MGVESIATREAGSFGVSKTNKNAVTNQVQQIDAAEWNRLADAVIELQEAVGTTDSPEAESLEARVVALEGGAAVAWKEPVRVATTANVTLSGAQTIDGVACVAGDRVLVKNQSTGSQNGIYVVASGAWSRASDMNSSAESLAGLGVRVNEGTTNADTSWALTTDDPITLGTTSLTFARTTTSADVVGPGSSTDNAIARFDATTGKVLQNSLVTVDDSGNISLPALSTCDGRDVSVDGAALDALGAAYTAHAGSGGSSHANAVASGAAGFMSGADKAILDAIKVGFRGLRTVTGSDTPADTTDAGGIIDVNAAGTNNQTIPPNASVAYDTKSVLTYLFRGAGVGTIVAGSGVTLVPGPGKTLVTKGQGSWVQAIKVATNTWMVNGDLESA